MNPRQKQAWAKQLSANPDVQQKKKSKRVEKELVKIAKRTLGQKWKSAVRERLQSMSRLQLLEKQLPRASLLSKQRQKKKTSVKKGLKKQHLKNTEKLALKDVRRSGASASSVPSEKAAEEPEKKAASLPEAEHGPLFQRKVRVLSRDNFCGKEGRCTSHNLLTSVCTVASVGDKLATLSLQASELVMVEPDWKKPLKWKSVVLSRTAKQEILKEGGGILLKHELPTSEDDDANFMCAEPVEVLKTKTPQMLLNQHMFYGWSLIRWHFSGFCESEHVVFLDPLLVHCLSDPEVALKNLACSEAAFPAMRKHCESVVSNAGAVFVPIFGTDPCIHWTLVVILLGTVRTVNCLDSKEDEHPECRRRAETILSILLPDKKLPAREDTEYQKSDDCGFWVLAFCVETLALLRNEGPRSRGLTRTLVTDIKTTLRTWLNVMFDEQKKFLKEQESEQKQEAANLKKAANKMSWLVKKKAGQSAELEELRALAENLINKGKEPTLADLPASARIEIEEVSRANYGICSRCRWSSGCLACSVKHAQRYHLNKLRASLGLAPLKVLPDQD